VSQEIGITHQRQVSKARLVMTAVPIEGRSQSRVSHVQFTIRENNVYEKALGYEREYY
jgi:hypothetical protein